MKVLVCDDDATTLTKASHILKDQGFEPLPYTDATEALMRLTSESAPSLAILDWLMPKMSGIEIVKRVRTHSSPISMYIIILTAKDRPEDLREAFNAGANDFIAKPFEPIELAARLTQGARLVRLEHEIKTLTGLLPICAWCKNIRLEDKKTWIRIEEYIEKNTYAHFSHGGCPVCIAKLSKTKTSRDGSTHSQHANEEFVQSG